MLAPLVALHEAEYQTSMSAGLAGMDSFVPAETQVLGAAETQVFGPAERHLLLLDGSWVLAEKDLVLLAGSRELAERHLALLAAAWVLVFAENSSVVDT